VFFFFERYKVLLTQELLLVLVCKFDCSAAR